jgi:hypothetical protein
MGSFGVITDRMRRGSMPTEKDDRTYTLADLEEAEKNLREGDSGRHNNPGRTRRWNEQARARVSYIRERLIEQGVLPNPEPKVKTQEQIENDLIYRELDRLHPNAKIRMVVEHHGIKFIRRYEPLGRTRSGNVTGWHGYWEKV